MANLLFIPSLLYWYYKSYPILSGSYYKFHVASPCPKSYISTSLRSTNARFMHTLWYWSWSPPTRVTCLMVLKSTSARILRWPTIYTIPSNFFLFLLLPPHDPYKQLWWVHCSFLCPNMSLHPSIACQYLWYWQTEPVLSVFLTAYAFTLL